MKLNQELEEKNKEFEKIQADNVAGIAGEYDGKGQADRREHWKTSLKLRAECFLKIARYDKALEDAE